MVLDRQAPRPAAGCDFQRITHTGLVQGRCRATSISSITLSDEEGPRINARRAAVLALMLFPGADGCKDAVLVDLCAAYRCLRVRMACMTGVGSPPSARHSVPGRVEEGLQQAGQGRVVAPDLSRTPQVVQDAWSSGCPDSHGGSRPVMMRPRRVTHSIDRSHER